LQSALTAQPDNVVLLVLLGSCYYKKRETKMAVQIFKRAHELAPHCAKVKLP
jgi:cytochrome c-type biogenesis protein CcmH/NrfG